MFQTSPLIHMLIVLLPLLFSLQTFFWLFYVVISLYYDTRTWVSCLIWHKAKSVWGRFWPKSVPVLLFLSTPYLSTLSTHITFLLLSSAFAGKQSLFCFSFWLLPRLCGFVNRDNMPQLGWWKLQKKKWDSQRVVVCLEWHSRLLNANTLWMISPQTTWAPKNVQIHNSEKVFHHMLVIFALLSLHFYSSLSQS